MKVSVILLVYNAEKTIKRAVESVLNQQYSDIEIIIMNDGSEDNTHAICEKMLKNNPNIKLINQSNKGYTITCNKGILNSTGDYIMFLDGDDEITPDAISNLMDKASDYDIICGNYNAIIGDKIFKGFEKLDTCEIIYGSKEYNIFKTESIFGYIWGKLYKKEFIDKNNITFYTDKKVSLEDNLFNIECFNFDPKYLFVDTPVYNYYRDYSYTTYTNINFNMLNMSVGLLEATAKRSNKPDLLIPLIARVFSWCMIKQRGIKYFNVCCESFFKSKEIHDALNKYDPYKELKQLPSKLQIAFFTYCIYALKKKSRFLLSIFLIFRPIMISYSRKNLVRV